MVLAAIYHYPAPELVVTCPTFRYVVAITIYNNAGVVVFVHGTECFEGVDTTSHRGHCFYVRLALLNFLGYNIYLRWIVYSRHRPFFIRPMTPYYQNQQITIYNEEFIEPIPVDMAFTNHSHRLDAMLQSARKVIWYAPVVTAETFRIVGQYNVSSWMVWDGGLVFIFGDTTKKLQSKVSLVSQIITNWSSVGETILDPVMGETSLWANRLNRKVVGFNKSKKICDNVIDMIENQLVQHRLL